MSDSDISSSFDTPAISVITPFYNSADLLRRCIDSVLAQSQGDFEYILADNRSSDGSTEIAAEAARRDRRIRHVRFEEHLPQVQNYNRALRLMSPASRWCKIVQADDYLMEHCLREMVRVGEAHVSIGIVSSLRDVEGQIDPPLALAPGPFSHGPDVCRAMLRGKSYLFGSPTTVMYRADLVRSHTALFRPDAFFDDVEAALEILCNTDFGFVAQVLSHSHRDPRSTLGRILRYDPSILMRHALLARVGQRYFAPGQLREERSRAHAEYHAAVARALLRFIDPLLYLKFHRDVLRDTGRMPLEPQSIASAAARLTLGKLRQRAAGRLAAILAWRPGN